MVFSPGIQHAGDLAVRGEKVGHGSRIAAVALHAQLQCFYPAQDQPGVIGSRHCSDGVLEICELCVKLGVVYHNGASHDVRMTVQVFRCGMHDRRSSQFQRALQDRRCKSVVHPYRQARRLADLDALSQVDDAEQRIRRGFQPDHLGVRAKGCRKAFGLLKRYEGRVNSCGGPEYILEEPVCASVDIVAAHHVISRREQVQSGRKRAGAAGKRKATAASFKRRQAGFEGGSRGIAAARIVVAFVLARSFLNEGGAVEDRRHDGPGGRIGRLPGMHRERCQAGGLEETAILRVHGQLLCSGMRLAR